MNRMKINVEYFLFYISYFLFSLYAFVGSIETYRAPLRLLSNISMIIILITFIIQFKKYKLNEFMCIVLLLLLSFMYIYFASNYLLLKLVLLIICTKNLEMDKLISYDVKLRIFLLLVMFVLSKTGHAYDNVAYFEGKIRHSMGFTNPNVFGHHILVLCMELFYVNRDKINITKIIMISLLSIFSYIYSGSRTAMILYFVFLILFLCTNKNMNILEKRKVKKFIIYSPIIISIFVYILYFLYKNNYQLGMEIDKLLSGRLFNIKFFSTRYSVNLFGNDIAQANKSCDTAPVYTLYAFGVSGFILYNLSIKKLFDKLYELKEYPLIIIMLIFVVYGISEKLWLFVDVNLFLVMFKELVYKRKRCDLNEQPSN